MRFSDLPAGATFRFKGDAELGDVLYVKLTEWDCIPEGPCDEPQGWASMGPDIDFPVCEIIRFDAPARIHKTALRANIVERSDDGTWTVKVGDRLYKGSLEDKYDPTSFTFRGQLLDQ